MKQKFAVIALIFAFLGAFASADKRVKNIPKGTARISFYTYIDKQEVSVADWKSYCLHLKSKFGDQLVLAAYPDSNLLFNAFSIQSVQDYLFSGKYDQWPITCISFDQAVNYCRWRTAQYKDEAKKHPDWFKEIVFHLPSKEQWTSAARAGNDSSSYFFGEVSTSSGKCKFNATLPASTAKPIFKSVSSGLKNALGMIHVHGNAAEMTSTRGVAVGGHMNLFPEDCAFGKTLGYAEVSPYVGFRCFGRVFAE